MKEPKAKPNLFVVDTPHQLLNAVEAVHSLQLKNNHLLVTRPRNGAQDRFTPLIKAVDWVTVSFPSVWIRPKHRIQTLLGSVGNRWYCRCLHLMEMLALSKVAFRFRNVDGLFLGHYSIEWTPFMRHIANTVKYNTLYLLDDGTDTIEINNRRHRSEGHNCEVEKGCTSESPIWKKVGVYLLAKYWRWNLADAPSVTFFTAYDLDVGEHDQLVRNNYSYLRSLAPQKRIYLADTVVFIGICSSDNYIEMDAHLDFLSEVRAHFAEKKILYVAHPRDSAACVARIREHLKCELWQCSSVIEYDLIVRGINPSVVGAFPSSALITLAHLMDPEVGIVSFHIAPEHWVHWADDAVAAYDYIKNKVQQRVTVVRLTRKNEQDSGTLQNHSAVVPSYPGRGPEKSTGIHNVLELESSNLRP